MFFIILNLIIFYLIILANPNFIFFPNNDLSEFFYPIIYFTKTNFLKGIIPFWNNVSLSGQPLWSDPQAPFYPFNIIFLLPFSINQLFVFSFFIHSLLAAIGMSLFLNQLLKNKKAAQVGAIIWAISPKFVGYLKAGHLGLIYSWAWLPFFFLFSLKIAQKPSKKLIALNSLIIYLLYLNHAITMSISVTFAFLLFTIFNPKKMLYFLISIFIAIGLLSYILIPQLLWSGQTTRFLLLNNPQTYPIWNHKYEILINSSLVYLKNFSQIDPEKWLFLGTIVTSIAFIQFFKLKTKMKIYLSIMFTGILIFSLNNANPFYEFLINFKPYILLRVTTRIWFIFNLFIIILFSLFLKNLKSRRIFFILSFISIIELFIVNSIYLKIPKNENIDSKLISKYIQKNNTANSKFRVLCTDRCISQKDAAINNLELIDGYNTLQQTNYFKHSWQLTGAYYNYYTLSIPPFGSYKYEELKPNINSLSEYNTKYLITKYKTNDNQLKFVNKINNYNIYEINNYLSRSYLIKKVDENKYEYQNLKLLYFSPNKIVIEIPENKISNQLILAEVYSNGWKAFDENKYQYPIMQAANKLRQITINQNAKNITFIYTPPGIKIGALISCLNLLIIIYLLKSNNIKPKTKVK